MRSYASIVETRFAETENREDSESVERLLRCLPVMRLVEDVAGSIRGKKSADSGSVSPALVALVGMCGWVWESVRACIWGLSRPVGGGILQGLCVARQRLKPQVTLTPYSLRYA